MKLLKLISYNIVIVVLLLLIMEFVIRITFPEISFTATSKELLVDSLYNSTTGLDSCGRGFSGDVIKHTNQFRCWTYSNNNNSEEKIELYLGDSVTMGICVENDSTFAGIVCTNSNILNPSIIGYSISDYKNVLGSFLNNPSYGNRIQSVSLFWTLNDLYDNDIPNSSPGIKTDNLLFPIVNYLRNNSKSFIFIKQLVSDRSKIYFDYDNQFYKSTDRSYQKSIRILEEIIDTCKTMGIEFSLYLLPYEYQLRNNYDNCNQPQELLKEELKIFNVKIIDIGDRLKSMPIEPRLFYLYKDGIHFSKLGHKIIAEIIMKEV